MSTEEQKGNKSDIDLTGILGGGGDSAPLKKKKKPKKDEESGAKEETPAAPEPGGEPKEEPTQSKPGPEEEPGKPMLDKGGVPFRKGSTIAYAVQIHPDDADIIRAVCKEDNITQKSFFEKIVDKLLSANREAVLGALDDYREEKRKRQQETASGLTNI